MEHGCKHGDHAIEIFENFMRKKHTGYRTIKCGMFINKESLGVMPPLIFYIGANAVDMVAEK